MGINLWGNKAKSQERPCEGCDGENCKKAAQVLRRSAIDPAQEKIWYSNALEFLGRHRKNYFNGERLANGIGPQSEEERNYYLNFSSESGRDLLEFKEERKLIEFHFEDCETFFKHL